MMRSTKDLVGFSVVGDDGRVGKIHDLLFDDVYWTIRYVVVSTGGWLLGRKVLVPTTVFGRPKRRSRIIPVVMVKDQIRRSPALSEDQPVSRQYIDPPEDHEVEWHPAGAVGARPAQGGDRAGGDPHLRSVREVVGYGVRTSDGREGRVFNLIVDDASWVVHFAVINTGKWLAGRRVMISTARVARIDWENFVVNVRLECKEAEELPDYDNEESVNTALEEVRHDLDERNDC
jgi:hypothetical protein